MGKKKEMSREDFERGLNSPFYGPGSDARKMLDRYGVAGVKHTHPDGRSGPSRSIHDVKRDLAAAMMNDYDTRRSMEAAAMAGNKDAKKYAKKGFEASTKSLMGGWNTMRDLKKEYVGGGGMDGAKNRASLTHALVKADREAQTAKYKEDFALNADLAALREEMNERADKKSENVTPATLSETSANANSTVNDYDLNLGSFGTGLFGDGGSPAEQAKAEEFKENAVATVKKGLKYSDVETRGPKSGFVEGEGF